ncbi:MAG: alpha-ketoglutarate-dependent dioxygenase AlkB [Candidatus Nanopelagicales bacterium]
MSWQTGLWDHDLQTFRAWPADARRPLSEGAWIDYVPGWLPHADALYEELHDQIAWRADERRMYDSVVAVPRLTAWFPRAEQAGNRTLLDIRDELNRHYEQPSDPFVSAGLCLYRNGDDSVALHGDRIGRGRHDDTLVAVLSLGSPRVFLLRPRGGGRSVRLTVGHGDLLVMGGSCQRTWDHAVPKSRRHVGARISVQYRCRGVA